MKTVPELAIVAPFYNEEESLGAVVEAWIPILEKTAGSYVFYLLADCPKDSSTQVAKELVKKYPRVEVVENTKNLGHGQTCLKGYRLANQRGAKWILQIDTDGQCDPQYFPKLWETRNQAPIHQAKRIKRLDGAHRWVASRILELILYLETGIKVIDPNCPYRLMKSTTIQKSVQAIPENFDLANIALACLLKANGYEHRYFPITFLDRYGGKPSASTTTLLKKFWGLHQKIHELPLNCQGRK